MKKIGEELFSLHFKAYLEDYFLLFEDKCSLAHTGAGRVMGYLSHPREKVVGTPHYNPRSIVDILDKYRDGHISDSGRFAELN